MSYYKVVKWVRREDSQTLSDRFAFYYEDEKKAYEVYKKFLNELDYNNKVGTIEVALFEKKIGRKKWHCLYRDWGEEAIDSTNEMGGVTIL